MGGARNTSFFALKFGRQWIWVSVLGMVWVIGQIMGFCWPWHLQRESPGSFPLRVMTWNVKYGSRGKLANLELMYKIDRNKPTVVLQDAEGGKGYGNTYGHFLLQHRLPTKKFEDEDRPYPDEFTVSLSALLDRRRQGIRPSPGDRRYGLGSFL